MAIKANTSGGKKGLFTGLCDMNVIAVNPTKEELMTILGTENINDTMVQYDNTKEGVAGVRIDLWLRNEEKNITTKVSTFVAADKRTSQTGNLQWINAVGQSGWAPTAEQAVSNVAQWPGMFRDLGVRQANEGEVQLYEFLVAWAKIDQRKDESQKLDTDWDVICSGDVSELAEIVKDLIDFKARVLLTVRDEKFQGVYTRNFLREGSNYVKGLRKNLARETRDINYGGDLNLQEFVPGVAPEDTSSEASPNSLQSLMR